MNNRHPFSSSLFYLSLSRSYSFFVSLSLYSSISSSCLQNNSTMGPGNIPELLQSCLNHHHRVSCLGWGSFGSNYISQFSPERSLQYNVQSYRSENEGCSLLPGISKGKYDHRNGIYLKEQDCDLKICNLEIGGLSPE